MINAFLFGMKCAVTFLGFVTAIVSLAALIAIVQAIYVNWETREK